MTRTSPPDSVLALRRNGIKSRTSISPVELVGTNLRPSPPESAADPATKGSSELQLQEPRSINYSDHSSCRLKLPNIRTMERPRLVLMTGK